MTPSGKSRVVAFEVAKVSLDFTLSTPILVTEFILRREDGAVVGSLTKKGPIPLFFTPPPPSAPASTSEADKQEPVNELARSLKEFLAALELDILPELFEGATSPTVSREGLPTGLNIPPTW